MIMDEDDHNLLDQLYQIKLNQSIKITFNHYFIRNSKKKQIFTVLSST